MDLRQNVDGAADIKPIALWYKSQVLEFAKSLGIPTICGRPPRGHLFPCHKRRMNFIFAPLLQNVMFASMVSTTIFRAGASRHLWFNSRTDRIVYAISVERRAHEYRHQPPLLV